MNVLFLCTGNSARSILAECLLNRHGAGRFTAFSAGSNPVGRVNPHAVSLLRSKGYPTKELQSKSWDEFSGKGAHEMDLVITVCDNAAGEACPIWPGGPLTAHWGFPDPAEAIEEAAADAFRAAYVAIESCVLRLSGLPVDRLTSTEIQAEIYLISPSDRKAKI